MPPNERQPTSADKPEKSKKVNTVWYGSYRFEAAAYDLTGAAALVGVTRQHLAAMADAGHIQVTRLGRRVVVPVSEIVRLLDGPSD
ncbi:MAG: helix-turn-helix domain-containing protein [Acidimicrobiales bacterium]